MNFPAQRATTWKLRTRTLEFDVVPTWMGIVNVTPDSFSDGGRFTDTHRAVDHALELVEQGATILDIGGESTRPYSTPVSAGEELRRVLPVVEELAAHASAVISIDTSKAVVAREAIAAGAEIVNDITGLEGDADMLPTVVELGAGVCAMHMQGTPQTMQDNPHYDEIVAEIGDYLAARYSALVAAGVEPERICLDPGVGFGKTHEHNITLVERCREFHSLGCPLLVGHSRKGFLGKIAGDAIANRDAATAGSAAWLACQGIQVIRVHNVAMARNAVLAFAACGGLG